MARAEGTARSIAVDALIRVEAGAYSHVLLPQMLRERALDQRDRSWVTDAVYGTLRMRRRLDHLLDGVVDRPLVELEPRVRAALRLGAWQLVVAGTPSHAAVGETVDTLPPRARGARGLVNAVLRRLAAAGPEWTPAGEANGEPEAAVRALGIATSHPDWIVSALLHEFGPETARAVLDADNEPPRVTIRVDASRATRADVAAELRATGASVSDGLLAPHALLVRGSGDLVAVPAVRDGRATPQDQSSQAVGAILDPQTGHRVLDVAAGPGGKSTDAAERVGSSGLVVACDQHLGRVRLVGEATSRLGVQERVALVVADGRSLPLRAVFDRVLVDAPCTGLGVIRRRAEARDRVDPTQPEQLGALQRDLLAAAAPLVAPGGRLVYSVCTWTRAETLDVAAWALEHLSGFRPVAIPPPWRSHGPGGLLLSCDGGDGMFVLALDRAPDGAS